MLPPSMWRVPRECIYPRTGGGRVLAETHECPEASKTTGQRPACELRHSLRMEQLFHGLHCLPELGLTDLGVTVRSLFQWRGNTHRRHSRKGYFEQAEPQHVSTGEGWP